MCQVCVCPDDVREVKWAGTWGLEGCGAAAVHGACANSKNDTVSEAFYVNTCMHSLSLSPAARDAPVIDRNRPNDEIRKEDAGDRHPDDPHATV